MSDDLRFPNHPPYPTDPVAAMCAPTQPQEDSSMATQPTKINLTPVVIAIIAAAVAIIGFFMLMEQRREYNAIYPGCWTLIDNGLECEAKVSAYRMTRGY